MLRNIHRNGSLILVLTALAAAPILYAIKVGFVISPIPHNDYWGMVMPWIREGSIAWDWRILFSRANEHAIGIPTALYLVNILLFDGSNAGLYLLALGAASANFLLLVRCLRRVDVFDQFDKALLVPLFSLFIFTPVGFHNWMHPFSGTHWFLANLLATGFITFAFSSFRRSPLTSACLLTATAAGGILTYSTFLMSLPAAAFYLLVVQRRWRLSLSLLAAFVVVTGLTLLQMERPDDHGSVAFRIIPLAVYVADYLGAVFSLNAKVMRVAGATGIVLFAAVNAWFLTRSTRGEQTLGLLPFLALSAYGFLNAALAGVGRGALQAPTESRYTSLRALFWIGLATCLYGVISTRSKGMRRTARAALALLMLVVSVPYLYFAWRPMTESRSRAAHAPVAGLAMQLDVADHSMIGYAVIPWLRPLVDSLPHLRQMHHVPFNKQPPLLNLIGTELPTHETSLVQGQVVAVERVNSEWWRVRGTVRDDGRFANILLVDDRNLVRGLGAMVRVRRILPFFPPSNPRETYWIGYFKSSPIDGALRVYGVLADGTICDKMDNLIEPREQKQ